MVSGSSSANRQDSLGRLGAQSVEWLRLVMGRIIAARWLWTTVMLFTITRLGIALIAYVGFILIPNSVDPPPYHLRPPDVLLLDTLGSRWDTGFYISIVEEGYVNEGVSLPSVAFFPLLPMLMTAIRPLVGGDALVAGLVVANAALLGAALFFHRLVAHSWGEKVAGRAVWYLLIFPASLFGSAIYSESLFLLCAIAALYLARRRNWWLAAVFGIAATMTRFMGLIVAPMLFMEWWQQRASAEVPSPGWRALAAPIAAPLGLLSYMVFLNWRFGDPLAFVHASASWGRVAQNPVNMVMTLLQRPDNGWLSAVLAGQIHVNDWMDLLAVLFFLAIGFVLLYQHQWSEGIFVWSGVMLAFGSGLLMSQRRYMWVLFPAFILLARWGEKEWVDRLITTVSLILLALYTALFANGYWVA